MRFLIVGVLAFIAKYFVLIKYLLKQIILYLIAEKIMVKYLGSLAHPMASSLMSNVKNGDSIILEINPSYYSTWNYGEKRR
jgi:hypothetical protein